MVISIADTIAATVIFMVWGNAAVAAFMVAAQLVLCLLLVSENRKVRTGD